jgi:hypothetical protein
MASLCRYRVIANGPPAGPGLHEEPRGIHRRHASGDAIGPAVAARPAPLGGNATASGAPTVGASTAAKTPSMATRDRCVIFSGPRSRHQQSRVPYSLNQAYALSVLWKAYGSGYASHSQTTYLGAFMATGPSGTQCRANTGSAQVYAALPTPGFGVPIVHYYAPFGYNANGRRTVILVGSRANEDYASGIIIEQWYSIPYPEAFLTAANYLAAQAETSPNNCVICVGSPAVTAIQNAANYYGLSLESFSSFSAWESSPNAGYINCAGSTAAQSYNLGLTAAQQAASAGWA